MGYFVWRPQWNEQILFTRSETRENETQYPNIVIATAVGDASHGLFGRTKKCAMKTLRTGEKAADCGGALSTYEEVDVVNMILFNATASLADTTSAVGGYLEVQASLISQVASFSMMIRLLPYRFHTPSIQRLPKDGSARSFRPHFWSNSSRLKTPS